MNIDRSTILILALWPPLSSLAQSTLIHKRLHGSMKCTPGTASIMTTLINSDSIGSGINYSPPLYFFLNWIGLQFFPLSLNALRVESLLCILGGTGLVFLTLRKEVGSLAALIGVGGVLLQSTLLGQSMEARSYGLFFFCGAAVLYTSQSLTIGQSRRKWAWAFIAHLALSLTHYLGIVFSVLAALSRYLSMGQSRNRVLKTSPEILSG